MSFLRFSLSWQSRCKVIRFILPGFLFAALTGHLYASVSASLSWVASSDTNVSGYNIFYGTVSQTYTNSITVGAVTNAVVPNLADSTTYFFAAKAHNSAGLQSLLSNQAAFAGYGGTPNVALKIKSLPKSYSSDSLVYSLDATAPPGATINPTNGTFSWSPGLANASTTNYVNVNVTDPANPAMNITETLAVWVSDYFNLQAASVGVASGQTKSLPITLIASGQTTNIQFALNWPSQLLNPTLTLLSPIVSGSLREQNGQLLVQLQTAANQPLIGTNVVAKVNFLAASGLPTTILDIPAVSANGLTAHGAPFNNVIANAGEVVVVGGTSMLRPQAATGSGSGRALSLYAPVGTYALQYTTSLARPVTWTTLTTYQQTNAFQTINLGSTNPVIYYRLHLL